MADVIQGNRFMRYLELSANGPYQKLIVDWQAFSGGIDLERRDLSGQPPPFFYEVCEYCFFGPAWFILFHRSLQHDHLKNCREFMHCVVLLLRRSWGQAFGRGGSSLSVWNNGGYNA